MAVWLAPAAWAGGRVTFDFETGDLQGWRVMEGRFGQVVSDRAMCRNTPGVPYSKQGKYYLSTVELPNGGFDDGMTGVIESPVFVLSSPIVTLQVGGGSSGETYVALCTPDGSEVFRASGANAEQMRRVEWNAAKLVGKPVFLAVVDRATGPWGHVTLDDFTANGRIEPKATAALRHSYEERTRRRVEKERLMAERHRIDGEKRLAELTSDEYLLARGRSWVYSGENLGAISFTVGGIATGAIQTDGKARLATWQIFNNYTQARVPESFFALRVKSGTRNVVRALQTEPVGPFAAMKSLSFRGEYPFAWYDFADPAVPVRVSMEVFSPLVPMNVKDSSIPCAVFRLTAENSTGSPAEVSFLASQQNAVGYTGDSEINGRLYPGYGGNTNRVLREGGAAILHMTSSIAGSAPGYGDMALAVLGADAVGNANWVDRNSLANEFSRGGSLSEAESAGPSPKGETVSGALAAPLTLGPGESRTVTFVLAWRFPNACYGQGGWGGEGNHYATRWPSALHVAEDMISRLDELTRLTRLYHDTLYQSNLPYWLIDRISSQVAILRSRTCFWTKDGYFGAWEGCGSSAGCCLGNCSHVWHYAQAHARLFPEIGRIMRDQELGHQTPDGGVPHRQAPGTPPATDGQCGTILESYREYLTSSDRVWLDRQWPRVKNAMDYVIAQWDADEDGVMAGRQWNTLDEALGGSSSWLGSLYLAALAASEKMAGIEGDAASAERYRRIRESGSKKQDATLLNGEYYFQIPDPEPRKDYNTGCHIDQVLGQWWASQLDLGWVYPPDRVRTALKSLLRYNFRPNFHGVVQAPRKFVDDDDSAMQMITWPKGGKPDPDHLMYYGDEVMSGFEYSAAAAMVQAGLVKEGFQVVRAAYDRYDGRLRSGLTGADSANWGYTGNPFGDDECGKFYARAMSVWSMLTACQGFVYDGPAGLIGFRPVWKPEDHVSFFTAAEGWGLFTQKRGEGSQTERIELRYGKLRVKSMVFELTEGFAPKQVIATLSGNTLSSDHSIRDGVLSITLASEVTLADKDALVVVAK